ncbi:MAG: multiheme c-type cytochrome [Kofleriaceae bacterium]
MRLESKARVARRAMVPTALILGCFAILGGTSCSGRRGSAPAPAPPGTTVTLFALAEVRGQIEPCGCTTDPLGDLARTAQLVTEARTRGPVVVVDAGSLLYPRTTIDPLALAQENLKADLLAKVYTDELQVAAVGLGPADLAAGPAGVRLPRLAANVPATAGVPLTNRVLIPVGDEVLGVFGVIGPDEIPALGASDPIAAARAEVADLRGRGAKRIVALATMSRKDAAALARAVDGIDVMVVALGALAPEPKDVHATPDQIGSTWMIYPPNRGQVVARLELTLRPGAGPLIDAVGPAAAADRRSSWRRGWLPSTTSWPASPSIRAPTRHVPGRKRAERDAVAADRAALGTTPLRAPATGSYFQLAQLRINKALACDAEVVAAKQAYTRAAGAANLAAAKAAPPPPPPPPGTAVYVGNEACSDCHQEAVDFWATTRHAGAWKTLVEVDKQFDYDCTSCHVTGWGGAGGATMANAEQWRDVGCETCHGPGSRHVEADDADAKATITLAPAEDLCATQCHTPEHSDTFDRTAYLRDVLGPGHGAAARAALGDGPTGRALRQAGLAKASATLGAGCPK